MPVTNGGNRTVVAGAQSTPLVNDGAPVNGTNEVETLTIGGTPAPGFTFYLSFMSVLTSVIAWSATNATLLANIQAALDAHPLIGTNGFVASAGSLTAGVGTVLLTAGGRLAKLDVALMVASIGTSAGTAPTVAVATTTPGVTATGRGSARGQQLIDTSSGTPYKNTSATPEAPAWSAI